MKLKVLKPQVVSRDAAAVPLGKNFYYMTGRKHKDGGIDIGKNPNTGLEVEDGEVMHLTDKEVKVFSSVPFLNGKSPAEKVLDGDTPNKVFNAQEKYKDTNGIKDDGTKKQTGGKIPVKPIIPDNTRVNRNPIIPNQVNTPGNPISKRDDFEGNIIGKLATIERTKVPQYGALSDLYNYFAGQPLEKKSLSISSDKPSNSKNPNAKYVSIDDNNFKKEVVSNYNRGSSGNLIKNGKGIINQEKKINDSTFNVSGYKGREGQALGHYTVSKGKDDKGDYISYYDTFDMTPGNTNTMPEKMGIVKPFEVYGRVHLDANGNIINKANKPSGVLSKIIKEDKPKMEYGGKSMNKRKYAIGGKKNILPNNIVGGSVAGTTDNFNDIKLSAESDMLSSMNRSNNAPTNAVIPSRFNRIVSGVKSTFQNGVDNIGTFYNENPGSLGDTVGAAGNIIGGLISNNANNKMLDKLKYPNAPVARQAAKLKTTININPQLDKMRESVASYERDIDNNTASSRVALARKQRGRTAAMLQTNELYGNKENAETDLINKDKLNQQAVNDVNTGEYNRWADGKANFNNTIAEKRSENTVGLIENLNAGIQDVITRGEKRSATRDNMLAISAASPNVNPRILKDLGVKSITDKMVADWEKANGKKAKKSKG